jgi:hypothetical protein
LLEQASAKSNLIFRQWDYIEEQFHILSSQDNDTRPPTNSGKIESA